MESYDFQLKTILHSYKQYQDSFLVYNKKDACFYTVGSISNLNTNEYETNAKEVAQRIEQFIEDQRIFLDKELMSQLHGCLKSRIEKIKASTTGLLGILTLLFYVFNPDSKNRLTQQRQILEKLKDKIDSALLQLKDEDIIDEDGTPDPLKTPSLSPHVTIVDSSPTSKKAIPQHLNTGELPAQLKTPFKTPSRGASKQPTPAKTPAKSNIPPPPPPPPPLSRPPIPNFKTAPSLSKADLLPNEPTPLTMDPINYKKLPKDELAAQIIEIETYIEQFNKALEPLRATLKESIDFQTEFCNIEEGLTELKQQLQHCQANLRCLEKGDKEGKPVILYFKSRKECNEIPFYPSDLQEEILKRNEILEEENLKKQKTLKQEINDKKQEFAKLDATLTDAAEDKATTGQNQAEKEKIQKSIDDLEEKLAQLSAIPPLDKNNFYPHLKLSQAIDMFESIIERLEERIEEAEKAKLLLQNKIENLDRNCKKQHGMDLEALAATVEKKTKELDTWARYKNSRVQWRDQKTSSKIDLKYLSKPTNKQPEIFKEYPILELLAKLPQNFLVAAKRESSDGADIDDILSDFGTRMYGMLHANKV